MKADNRSREIMPEKKEGLYSYYQGKDVLPTHARFSRVEELDNYKRQREEFFTEKLHLPAKIFKNADLIEFGPDSGENSLVFADWGSSLTLVEPNPKAWPYIAGYFEKFGFKERLVSLEKVPLEEFSSAKRFQIIDAEGFIYTVRPESVWIKLFSDILQEKGFFIISYMEVYGSFIELLHKLIYARAKIVLGKAPEETAWGLFRGKWLSLKHTRSFDSWVMDVLENPYVRLKYFLDPRDLCGKLAPANFSLYSSWPNYKDSLSVYWHKKDTPFEQRLGCDLDFISRSCLSFTLGRKMFLSSSSREPIARIRGILLALVRQTDDLIDNFDKGTLENCLVNLRKISEFLGKEAVLADSPGDSEWAIKLLECLVKIFMELKTDNFEELTAICNSESTFVDSWGMPFHYSVFRKN